MKVRGLSKTFVGTRVLKDASLEVRPGEIHSLVGGNGSGKSTLIKILTGIYEADPGSGEVELGGRVMPADALSATVAYAAGVRVVHQDLGVFLDLSIAENLCFGSRFETWNGVQVRWSKVRARTEEIIARFEIHGRPWTLLRDMSRAAHTQVAIARALQDQDEHNSGLLILDEPTASLPRHEVDLLLAQLRRYAASGQSILYVSHRLDEVLALSDRVSVLRDGEMLGTWDAASLTEEELIRLIVGRDVEQVLPSMPPVTSRREVLRVDGLAAGPLRDVSFGLLEGEVLGIAGVLGSGRTELLRAIFGDLRITSGTLKLDGQPARFKHPRDAIAAGVVLVPEDRALEGAFLDLELFSNAVAPSLRRYWRSGRMAQRRMREDGIGLVEEFDVRASSVLAPLNTLSGGNQQKVMVGRWWQREPRVLLLDEPTQGVDVGARADIYAKVRASVERGTSAIVVASDLEELAHIADRVLVMQEARLVAEVRPPDINASHLLQLANGGAV